MSDEMKVGESEQLSVDVSLAPRSGERVRVRGNRTSLITACALLLSLSACKALGPDFFRPKSPVPAEYKEMAGWKQAQPRDQELRGNWWELYNDPVLNGLIEQVSVSNQTLAQAEARYRQARALVTQARAAYFPLVNATASATRSRSGSSSSSGVAG